MSTFKKIMPIGGGGVVNTENFAPVTYTGNSASGRSITGVGFQPDLIWNKQRNGTTGHNLTDSVRGVTKSVASHNTNAEFTQSYYTSFDSDGWTFNNTGINTSGETFVSWCFKAGGTAVSNTDGTITSQVSANQDAGFSIVKYTGNGVSNATIGHGLSSAPEFVIIKSTSNAHNWFSYHKDSRIGQSGNPEDGYMLLNTTSNDNPANSPLMFNSVAPSSTVLNLASYTEVNGSSKQFISYCFHSVDGYSKIGSYTGNGSASGPIVETGFEPAFVMIKRTDSTSSWYILDNQRIGSYGYANTLFANLSNAEENTQNVNGYYPINFLSNGFEILQISNGYNANGSTYIYLAIAADPDVTQPTVENSFDVVTYTGNGTTQTINTDFKPDLVWLKSRNNASWVHFLQDSIRGAENFISSNRTDAEGTTTPHIVDSFDTNGFTVLGNGNSNTNGDTYVAWCWKAGDHDDNLPQINTNGTIDSVVSVNPEAGFSIVKWTNTVSESSVGHGLSQKPQLIIAKSTSSSANWIVYTDVIDGSMDYLRLNLSDAKGDSGRTLPNSSVFYFAGDTEDYIAYLFHSVDGYQKIGSYTGNTSGVTVTTGFRPRWIIIKNATAGGDHWGITDSVRNPSGQTTKALFANLANSESDNIAWGVTFTSNGFEVPSTSTASTTYNENGQTFIYLAIA